MKVEKFTDIGSLKERRSSDKYVAKNFQAYTDDYKLATEKEIETNYADVMDMGSISERRSVFLLNTDRYFCLKLF